MKHPKLIDLYDLTLGGDPRLVTLKAKYNACANKLNRNKLRPGTLTVEEEKELTQQLYVIKQLILGHEDLSD